jgi:uncharacterized protein with FMN-binding domain
MPYIVEAFMKGGRGLFLALVFGIAVLCAACAGTGSVLKAGYEVGVYEGSGRGYRGPITVSLQISPAGIEDIVIVSHRDSPYPGLAAMEELLDEVLESGSTDLDAITGATFSSKGFLEAVEDALKKASFGM